MRLFLGALLFIPLAGGAQDLSRWARQGSSLVFYDASGELSEEIGLGTWEDSSGSRVNVREILGGASRAGRFAWTLERVTTWTPDRTKFLESRRSLRLLGSNGKELWKNTDADIPEGGEPLAFSTDGESLIFSWRDARGWTASVRSYLGASLMEAGPFARLEMLALTQNGRYALIRWRVPDKSATHTFLDVARRLRVDIPSSELTLGLARITDEGKVYSGKRFVYDFGKAESEPKPSPAPKPAAGSPKP